MTESAGTPFCTIAGLVLLGRAPRKVLREAGVRLMVFEGKEKECAAKLDEIVDAPLAALWVPGSNGKREFAEGGLVQRVVSLLKPFITRESGQIGRGFRREVIDLYPMDAVRETLINALAHRDWTRPTDIGLVVYSDRLELTSPGTLPNTMTIEKMIAGQRMPRNPIIVEVLRDYGYVDARGMGVRNKIIPLVRQATGKDPIFEETDDYLRTTLPATEVSR
jgi:ATP-dependent DNA helicase RecG